MTTSNSESVLSSGGSVAFTYVAESNWNSIRLAFPTVIGSAPPVACSILSHSSVSLVAQVHVSAVEEAFPPLLFFFCFSLFPALDAPDTPDRQPLVSIWHFEVWAMRMLTEKRDIPSGL